MPMLTVVDRAGEERTVDAEVGLSVMEVLKINGFDELLALCGGCCSCATCHVHVDPAYLDRLPAMNADEDDLLDVADDRDATSRLSCQVRVTAGLDGMRVTIAAED
ncbi:2Fe-2S iron-sulfur cluster-binding protein [Sphingomonas sp. 2R-10]|uniref:2Fe-2S iron-sulfur cluster-binding protein n=1 Tax=Sphingomonas sp. 2R-10 TaxID=3045148 RepID=UPI000F7978FF|nr:2Fe-2S iron-sulfur cluster-binding protein [Sphingomonas sp. 2R-10]MDJ0276504.1 2Fe-2S iron-sulfur cluster-binding protein [Sphingomonas sp. 2R-10]